MKGLPYVGIPSATSLEMGREELKACDHVTVSRPVPSLWKSWRSTQQLSEILINQEATLGSVKCSICFLEKEKKSTFWRPLYTLQTLIFVSHIERIKMHPHSLLNMEGPHSPKI